MGKSKSKGLSCFGKPKGADLDGEYKAKANVKVDAPKGDISANLPSADASIAVESPEIDVKPVKASGQIPSGRASIDIKSPTLDTKPDKPKSAGLSCFGKSKEKDLDAEYKASAD